MYLNYSLWQAHRTVDMYLEKVFITLYESNIVHKRENMAGPCSVQTSQALPVPSLVSNKLKDPARGIAAWCLSLKLAALTHATRRISKVPRIQARSTPILILAGNFTKSKTKVKGVHLLIELGVESGRGYIH